MDNRKRLDRRENATVNIRVTQFCMAYLRSDINTAMSTTNKKLTDKQFQICCKQQVDTWAADKWVRDQGFTIRDFDNLVEMVLHAQRQAHLILKNHKDLINDQQKSVLVTYHRKYFNYQARKKIKETEARQVLNIASKINRKIFQLHRQLPKAA